MRARAFANQVSFTYDVAIDGGLVGNYPSGVFINPDSIFVRGFILVLTTFVKVNAPAMPTVAIGFTAAGTEVFLLAPTVSAGLVTNAVVSLSQSAGVKFTAAMNQLATDIATDDFSAGKFICWMEYIDNVNS